MPGTVLSEEPGIYFVPALIDKLEAEGKYKGIVNYEKLKEYRDFGGIRLEDDLVVTETSGRVIGDKQIPITVEDVEAIVGKA
jgi:Xaa-Pro aminopeptidase